MKLRDLLEAPLADIEYHKDPENKGSYSDKDRAVIKKYMQDNVYHEKLKGLPFDFYVYLIDDHELKALGRLYPEGEIDDLDAERYVHPDERHIPDSEVPGSTADRQQARRTGVVSMKEGKFPVVIAAIKANKKKNPNGVHFVMGDNYSADYEMAPTPWMIVHRLSHALVHRETENGDSLENTYGRFLERLYHDHHGWKERNHSKVIRQDVERTLYSFKSAKAGKISPGEQTTELITQYLITGKIDIDYPAFRKYIKEAVATEDVVIEKDRVDHWIESMIDDHKKYVMMLKKFVDRDLKSAIERGAVYYI